MRHPPASFIRSVEMASSPEAASRYRARRKKRPAIPHAARLPLSPDYLPYGKIRRRIFAVKLGMLAGSQIFPDIGRPPLFLSSPVSGTDAW